MNFTNMTQVFVEKWEVQEIHRRNDKVWYNASLQHSNIFKILTDKC